jgi:CheY-like chemotaxis protein
MSNEELKGKRVFYIDDDTNNRAIVTFILDAVGAKVAYDRWGTDATITLLKEFLPIDLILLDIMLPEGVTGYDVFDSIRREPSLEQIPVVAISSADPSIEMPKARNRGFSGFISKPVSIKTFPAQLEKILNGVEVWAAS